MKIIPVNSYNLSVNKLSNSNSEKNCSKMDTNSFSLQKYTLSFSNHFLVAFGARVDKGLERFVDANAEIMPKTVAEYIKTLPVNTDKSPIDAHREAFSMLELAGSVEEIKEVFPDEPLFQNLVSTKDSKARVGLIHDINVMQDVFNETTTPPIKTGDDLTVYLVKKVFLENKSLPEINDDLDNDLDDVFKKDDKKYVGYSTLDALGIKYPDISYLTSLRYTQEGYSDKIGAKLSKSLADFYSNLTPQERTERNTKSLNNIEKWWSGLSDEDKKALLVEKSSELAFLNLYEKSKKSSTSKPSEKHTPKAEAGARQAIPNERADKIKTALADDPMFVEWAKLNLEAYRASLTPEELAEISEKKSQQMIDMWTSFTPEEKNDYISNMFVGSEKQKFAMIDAWNNSLEVRQDLSAFLKVKNLYRPEGLTYRTQEYSEAQSKVMKEFWETYPQHAEKLGIEISESYKRIARAFENGTFDTLKQEILDSQSAAKKQFRNRKFGVEKQSAFNEFAKQYTKAYSFLPKDFLSLYLGEVEKMNDDDVFSEWSKALKGEINSTSSEMQAKLGAFEGSIFTEKAAVRQALADVLYDATGNSEVFSLKYSQLVSIIAMARENAQRPLSIATVNGETKKEIDIDILRDINVKNLSNLYAEYSRPMKDSELKRIMDSLDITEDNPLYSEAADYVKRFGCLIKKLVQPDDNHGMDALSYIQNNFLEQIKNKELGQLLIDSLVGVSVKRGANMMMKKHPFLPEEYAKRKVDDMLIKSVDSPIENYEKMIDSNVADEYMAFVLRCTLYSITHDNSVFGYTLDDCVSSIKAFYDGKKKIGDSVVPGGAKALALPDFKNIPELYNMLSDKDQLIRDDWYVLPVEISDAFTPEKKKSIMQMTSEFNKKYYSIMIYLELLSISHDKKEEILLNMYKDYIEHAGKVTSLILKNAQH